MDNVCNLAGTGANTQYILVAVCSLIIFAVTLLRASVNRNTSNRFLPVSISLIVAVGALFATSHHAYAISSDCDNSVSNNTANTDEPTTPLSPLLANASLLLRASSVQEPWDDNVWVNEGTLGAQANGIVDGEAGTQTNVPVLFDKNYQDGPGFIVEGVDPDNYLEYGFRVAHNDAFNMPNSGARTISINFTPIDTNKSIYKVVWKYAGQGIGGGGLPPGWVLENVDDIGGGPGSGGLLWPIWDGVAPLGTLYENNISPGRQTVTIRVDRSNNTTTMFLNGSPVSVTSLLGNDLSTVGDATNLADFFLAKNNVFHNVVVHDFALTDQQILDLHGLINSN